MQPILKIFPMNSGRRTFQEKYYKIHNWIEYSISKDSVFCFPCRHFLNKTSVRGRIENTIVFVHEGFKRWKNQKESFIKHELSDRHLTNIGKWNLYLSVKKNQNSVANVLIHSRIQEIAENRQHVKFLLKVTLFLGKQGLAFRGKDEENNSPNKGNLKEIIEMFCEESLKTKLLSKNTYGHYTSPVIQNQLIHVIAQCTKEIILKKISSFGVFAILVDETKDSSKKEQLSFILRFTDNQYNIHEKSLGCYHMMKCDAKSLSDAIIQIVEENKLDINNCVAQCYDGASVMSGSFTGVQKRISQIVPHAVYIHCHAHRLNLCLINSIVDIQLITDFFDTVQGLYKYLMISHTRYELFINIQKKKDIKVLHLERLVETRWSYWFTSLDKIKQRYTEIREVLIILTTEGDQTARAIGLLKEVSTFKFIVILHIMKKILECVHCASCELQSNSILLSSAMNLVNSTKENLKNLRNDETYNRIYEKSKQFAIKNKVLVEENEERNNRLKRKLSFNKNLDNFFVNSTLGKSNVKFTNAVKSLKVDVLYIIIDK